MYDFSKTLPTPLKREKGLQLEALIGLSFLNTYERGSEKRVLKAFQQ